MPNGISSNAGIQTLTVPKKLTIGGNINCPDIALQLRYDPETPFWGILALTTPGNYQSYTSIAQPPTPKGDLVLSADNARDVIITSKNNTGKIRFATSQVLNSDEERMTITPSGKIIINPSSQTINPLGKFDINLHPAQNELPKISFTYDDNINFTNPAICFYRAHSGVQTEAHTWRIEMDNPNYTNLSFKSYLGTILPGSDDDINGANDKVRKLVEFQRDGTVIFSGPEPESYSNIWFPEGEGSRFVWARQKSAIRAGKVGNDYINEPDGSDYWNYDNIGLYSSSFGYNCQAKSPFSFSIGKDCKAGINLNDKVSISIGLSCNSFDEAIAIGDHANAYGHNSLAIGKNCFSYGDYSTTMGNYSRTGSISLGYEGAFYIGDKNVDPNLFNDPNDIVYSSNLDNQLTLRFTGSGYDDLDMSNPCMRLLTRKAYVNGSWEPVGMFLYHGGYGWVYNSDSNLKKNKQDVITFELLSNLRNVPIKTWQWINDSLYSPSSDSLQTGYYRIDSSSCRWLGPMSQDFYREIPYGIPDSSKICSSVIDGVLIASVQALADITDEFGRKVIQSHEICNGKPCQMTISAKELITGVYIYGIELSGQVVKSKKMMIIK